ncbi:MAG: heavy-metal-associated domain-containing protein [Hydrococcus sp. Prado102]|jgi:hypothetical protein|nr:heavy-metal-associated domain-containing protein [Hydrococcus sp. Prado102]
MTNFGKGHRGLELVSAVAGRLRFRALDPDTKADLETIAQQTRELDGIREVRVNLETGSLLVVFDPSSLEEKQLLSDLEQFGVRQPEKSTDSQARTLEKTSKRLVSLLPALGGIVTTRMLGFTGWRAIGAYFVSTEILHFLLEPLKSSLSQTSESSTTETQSKSKPHREVEKSNRETPTKNSLYRVAHQVRGRIRLIVPKVTHEPDYAKRLQRLASSTQEIEEIRINLGSGSVIIVHDKQIDGAAMLSRLETLLETAQKTEEINSDNEREEAIAVVPETPPVQETATETNETVALREETPPVRETATEINDIALPEEIPEETSKAEVSSEKAPAKTKKEIARSQAPQRKNEANASINDSSRSLFNWSSFRASSLTVMLNLMSNLQIKQFLI